MKLTKKQKLIFDFISDYVAERGFSPSYREIAAGLGLKSPASVAEHVDHLVAMGALRRTPGAARALEVVDISFPETTVLIKSKLDTVSTEEAKILVRAAEILGVDLND